MTIGSLFSGIGGLDLGLERATGGKVIWNCEIDPYCRAVLAKHWPDARRYEDVRTIGAEVERPDIICGGFPCQDISIAKVVGSERRGLDGERSGLWSEYARVLRVLRPRFALMENVPEISYLGLDRVLLDLAECGYSAEWDLFSAAGVGAWHLRERWFLLAYTDSERVERPYESKGVGIENEGARQSSAADRTDWAGGWMGHARGERLPVALLRGTDARVPHRVDRIRALGNCVVPQVAEKAWRVLYERAVKNG